MARHLAGQLAPMGDDLKAAAGETLQAEVISRDPLPPFVQAEFTKALTALFERAKVSFSTDPSQTTGLVVRMGGAELAWTLDTYIDGLEALIGEHLATNVDHKAIPHEP